MIVLFVISEEIVSSEFSPDAGSGYLAIRSESGQLAPANLTNGGNEDIFPSDQERNPLLIGIRPMSTQHFDIRSPSSFWRRDHHVINSSRTLRSGWTASQAAVTYPDSHYSGERLPSGSAKTRPLTTPKPGATKIRRPATAAFSGGPGIMDGSSDS